MKKICLAGLILALCLCLCACKSSDYSKAMEQFNAGEFTQAREVFAALADYKDSAEMVHKCDYQMAAALLEDDKYEEALNRFQALGDYKDSAQQCVSCACELSRSYADSGRLKEAVDVLMDYSQDPQVQEVLSTVLINEIINNYLPNVTDAQEYWNEYLLIWLKALQAEANRTPAGSTINIPKVDQSAPQVVSLQRSMENANQSVALIQEAYHEEALQLCGENVRNLVATLLESAEVISKRFADLDGWAVTTMYYALQENNATKANNGILNALYRLQDAVEAVTEGLK